MRIQKYLSMQGILSRRKAEEYLKNGWISVNGKVVTELGYQFDPQKDVLELADEIKKIKEEYIYLAYYKPRGILTNCAQNGEKEIRDVLPAKYRQLHSIGRLDKESEGLILLTNDGIFAKAILNAEIPHTRKYEVWINKELTEDMREILEQGVYILGIKTKKTKIEVLGKKHFHITLREGKNRQIRRMVRNVEGVVLQLKRVQFGNIKVEPLRIGDYRLLTKKEITYFLE